MIAPPSVRSLTLILASPPARVKRGGAAVKRLIKPFILWHFRGAKKASNLAGFRNRARTKKR